MMRGKRRLSEGDGTGSTYQGQWKKGARDGYGVRTYVVADTKRGSQPLSYIGFWKRDQRHGLGEQVSGVGDRTWMPLVTPSVRSATATERYTRATG